jgi:competence protein ComEC
MLSRSVPFWKKVPFFRLLIPFVGGITLQSKQELDLSSIAILSISVLILYLIFSAVATTMFFRWTVFRGLLLKGLVACIGMSITYFNTIRNDKNWIGNRNYDGAIIFARLEEPLVVKPNSYKADASITHLFIGEKLVPVRGKIILYFEKINSVRKCGYGSQVVFKKKLQAIRNSGNPGAFDYRRYCEFRGIHFQVYLKAGECIIPAGNKGRFIKQWLYRIREKLISILQTCINGHKETGVAEALLIGYRSDLDKALVQAYSNTGVVHIIAISGLHLGLIYSILVFLLKPLSRNRFFGRFSPYIIIIVLWSFSLLTGASASVLRSALMFTMLVIGESGRRKSSVFNSLGASAFLILGYDPFLLWDVGFQLSYAAVLSILLFMKLIDNWVFFSNKFLQKLWKLNAITLAAQVLTVPLVMYHFHQFPTLFLITNLVAVPLSSFILLGEIVLCIFYFVKPFAFFLGKILQKLIGLMNAFIEKIDSFSFSVVRGIQLSIVDTILLYAVIFFLAHWLVQKSKGSLVKALIVWLLFIISRLYTGLENYGSLKVIVYNIPHRQAIDFIRSGQYFFLGDPVMLQDQNLQNFNLKPARTLYHAKSKMYPVVQCENNDCILVDRARIFIIDENFVLPKDNRKVKADLVVLSRNAPVQLEKLGKIFLVKNVVADATNSLWKIRQWKSDAERLHLRFHSVPEQGAFVMDF